MSDTDLKKTENNSIPLRQEQNLDMSHKHMYTIPNNKKSEKVSLRDKLGGIKLKWKLFAFLVIFVVFALLVVWFFQVGMLDNFYRDARHKDIVKAADTISSSLTSDRENISDTALQCASDYGVCIRLFKINDNKASEIASVEGSGGCFIHFMGHNELSLMVNQAIENDGVFVETLDFSPFKKNSSVNDKDDINISDESKSYEVDDDAGRSNAERDGDNVDRNEYDSSKNDNPNSITHTDEKVSSEIYVKVFNASDGYRYAMFINANLVPVNSIVSTLNVQFIWIMILMTVGALVLALVISGIIAKPVSDMNTAAKKLSCGEYDVVFPEKGCRETRELAATLNHTAVELSKNDRLQKELIANISHDLRTPLTMICGYSEVMRDIPGENTPENMQVIIDEATRMSELVKDILDISKIRSGSRAPSFEYFDITETVNTVLQRYEKLIEHDGYQITFSYEDNITVLADRTMILQVVYNLINNAVNYCGEDKKVRVTQTVSSSKVRITVSDNGVGISAEDIQYVWDRYYKIDRVHKIATVGTGLGLSIVKEILEQHDATYGVYSTPGVGSAFWFELKIENL